MNIFCKGEAKMGKGIIGEKGDGEAVRGKKMGKDGEIGEVNRGWEGNIRSDFHTK